MGQESRDVKILVTGGQGFLGQALVKALVRLGYSQVVVTCRRPAPELVALGIDVQVGDLSDPDFARHVCQDRQLLFHTAAKAGVWGDESEYMQSNVVATLNLVRAAELQGVSYFVHTSSPSVTFQGTDCELEDESVSYGQAWNAYCKTKIESEKQVLRATKIKSLALRPHLIYGPGDPHLVPRVLDAARKGRLVRIGDGLNQVDVTHISDAVEAHLLALKNREKADIWGQAYFITSGIPIRLWGWIAHLLSWKGLPQVKKNLSLERALKVARVCEALYLRLGGTQEPPLTVFSALQLGCTHTYSIEKARTLLGYTPVVHPLSNFDAQWKGPGD